MGPTCGTLKLKPAPAMTAAGSAYALYPTKRPLPPKHEGATALQQAAGALLPPEAGVPITWGGTVAEDADGTTHLFVDVCCYTPTTIMHDLNGCQTVHATSKGGLNQSFTFSDVALPAQHVCPHITRRPDGTYLLYSTGQSMSCNTTCTGNPAEDAARSNPTEPVVGRSNEPCEGTGFFGRN